VAAWLLGEEGRLRLSRQQFPIATTLVGRGEIRISGELEDTMDPFRPQFEPARSIYDAFVAESGKRRGRSLETWIEAERQAVWRAAQAGADHCGLTAPSVEQVLAAERLARGHVDYGSKWAIYVAEAMKGTRA
jgi:hypothetical protein